MILLKPLVVWAIFPDPPLIGLCPWATSTPFLTMTECPPEIWRKVIYTTKVMESLNR
jgi:hypothetical protein